MQSTPPIPHSVSHSFVNPRRLLAAIVVIAAFSPGVLMTAPAVAAQLSAQWHLSPARIGYLFSTELGAMSLATLPAWWWINRCRWRRVALLAAAVFFCGNLLSAFTADFYLLLPCRFITALAGGTLMILCITCAAGTPNPGRVFSFWILGQLLLGALGLLALPPLFARFGLSVVYLLLAALMLCCSPLLRAFPEGLPPQNLSASAAVAPLRKVLAVLAVLLFYTGQSAVWTFSGTIAAAAGLARIGSGQVLAAATLFGMAGACTAALLAAHSNSVRLLRTGYLLLLASILLFGHRPLAVRFALAAALFEFSWTCVLPFILSRVAVLDNSGRLMNSINLVIGGGLALGPSLAGHLLEKTGGTDAMLLLAAGAVILSLTLITVAGWKMYGRCE